MPFFVVAAIATGAGIISGNKARKDQKRASQADQASVRITNAQNKREFLRSFREAQAQSITTNIQGLGGGYESSRGFADTMSLTTQKNLAVKEFDEQSRLGQYASEKRIDASRYGFASATFAQLGNFAASPAGQDIIGRIGGD